jgi:hypothetical protein
LLRKGKKDTQTDERGFMKYAVEMGSGATTKKFHKDWFRYSKTDLGELQTDMWTAWSLNKSILICSKQGKYVEKEKENLERN